MRRAASALLLVALAGCTRERLERAVYICVGYDHAAENAAIIACIAAGQRHADDDADDLAEECRIAMRDSLCLESFWQYQTGLAGEVWHATARCDAGTPRQKAVCRVFGWRP